MRLFPQILILLALFTFNSDLLDAQWVQTNGPGGGTVFSLTVSGKNLFAGTSDGVYLSTNNGTSWSVVGLTSTNVNALAISGANLFAGTNSGVFRSTNNGTNWTAVNTGLMNTQVMSLAVSGTNLIAGAYIGGIFLSTDNGTSWSAVNPTIYYVYALAV